METETEIERDRDWHTKRDKKEEEGKKGQDNTTKQNILGVFPRPSFVPIYALLNPHTQPVRWTREETEAQRTEFPAWEEAEAEAQGMATGARAEHGTPGAPGSAVRTPHQASCSWRRLGQDISWGCKQGRPRPALCVRVPAQATCSPYPWCYSGPWSLQHLQDTSLWAKHWEKSESLMLLLSLSPFLRKG